jgi:hypothetical protein
MSNLVISLHDYRVDTERKFDAALETLAKASGIRGTFQHEHSREMTPYRALFELTELAVSRVEVGIERLHREIGRSWLQLEKATGDAVYKLKGKVFINPKTGRALTIKEWNVIKRDLTRVLGHIYQDATELTLKRAIALGKILGQMPVEGAIAATYEGLAASLPVVASRIAKNSLYDNVWRWSQIHTGEYIQDMTQRNVQMVSAVVMKAQQEKWTTQKLDSELFDNFSTLNRDWRRIAETETATNFNNGYLITEMEKPPKGDSKHIFMRGLSGSGACDFCRGHVNGQIVVLLDESPGGDDVEIDGKPYTAIWPGKSNFGRKRAQWWVASGTQHPHCRCTWTRFYPGMEKYEDMLREAMLKVERDAEEHKRNARKRAEVE